VYTYNSSHIWYREVLQRIKEERSILQTIKRRKANWIGHILHKKCLLRHIFEGKIEGRIEVTGRRRRKQLLDHLKEKRRLETERSTRSHSVYNLLWKRLPICCKTGYRMSEWHDTGSWSFETTGTVYPLTKSNIPEDLTWATPLWEPQISHNSVSVAY
jgi:hypothetical protein